MKRRELKQEEKDLLFYCLNKHEPKLIQELDKLYTGTLDADIINEMRDTIGLELTDKGFSSDWELNEYGLKLENLVDRLADLFLWPGRKK